MTAPASAIPPPGGGVGGGGGGSAGAVLSTLADEFEVKRQEANLYLEPLNFNLMGDNISVDSGRLIFSQLDVSLPGNSNLEVAIRRDTGPRKLDKNGNYQGFGDWQLGVPSISTIVRTSFGGQWKSDRCSAVTSEPGAHYIQAIDHLDDNYWQGMMLNIPGRGSKNVLEGVVGTQARWATSPAPKRVTTDHWVLSCIAGNSGEGFLAISPQGTRYKLNRYVELKDDPDSGASSFHTRPKALLATEVTDVHGNWVKYEYNSNDQVTRIHSNDLREITLAYGSDKLIDSVTANGRTWLYTYVDGYLTQVQQPDTRTWSYNLDEINDGAYHKSGCGYPYTRSVDVTNPYGTTATFTLQCTLHGRKDVQAGIISNSGQPVTDTGICGTTHKRFVSKCFRTLAVTAKVLSGPTIPSSTWTYAYSSDTGSFSDESITLTDYKTQSVTDPLGRVTINYTDRRWGATEGQLMKVETYAASGGTLLERKTFSYQMPGVFGATGVVQALDNDLPKTTPSYVSKTVTTRDGDTFTQDYAYNTNPASSSYSYGHPVQTQSYSNVSTTPRITDMAYVHDKTNWILGLTQQVDVGDGTTSRQKVHNSFDAKGRKTVETHYGLPFATFTYDDSHYGLLSTITDANGITAKAENWHRGLPRKVISAYGTADEIAFERTIDANGWVTAIKDPMLQTTSYAHDDMGRLTTVTPPINSATTIAYNFSTPITQTIVRGPRTETITYDSFFRPTATNLGNEIYTATSYDAAGQKTFESFPSDTANPTTGTTYTYDGLGRPKTIVTSAGTTTHDYYANHTHRITDPAGKKTYYYARGYDGPGSTDYTEIHEDIGAGAVRKTRMFKDLWGDMYRLRQWGGTGANAADESQYFFYDTRRRLCRKRTPEGGDTLYAYDDAGRLTSYAKGQSGSSDTCATPSGNNLVTLTHDDLGRVTSTNFADTASTDITRTYDDNGNVKTVNRGTGSTAANWAYTYNAVNALLTEKLDIDGKDFDLSYSYDTHGRLTNRSLPTGRTINLTLDNLGRTTDASGGGYNYAAGLTYHPTGDVAGFTYGNGIVYTKTLDAMLRPSHVKSDKVGTTIFDRSYSYDSRSLVTGITDAVDSAYNQSFTYDSLRQLKTATGKWGTATYDYDAIGNILLKNFSNWGGNGTRNVAMSYGANNRLTAYTDTGAGGNKSFTYDSRGNVTSAGSQSFTYDMADQPITASGTASGTYQYDGNLKRVKNTVGGTAVYNVYDASGRLVHVHIPSQGNKRTDYIHVAGMTLNRIDQGGLITALHNDHLGSIGVGTDGNTGSVLWEERYTPYGEALTAAAANDNQGGFTGHIKDAATGLNYMQARYYDPVGARFLSIDPVTFNGSNNPAFFNRYSYAFNDPVNLTDPTGRSPLRDRYHATGNGRLPANLQQPVDTGPAGQALAVIATNIPGVGVIEAAVTGEGNIVVAAASEIPALKALRLAKLTKKQRKAQVKADRKARKDNERASDSQVDYATKDMTKDQKREFHDAKKRAEGDRSNRQIQEDAEDIKRPE